MSRAYPPPEPVPSQHASKQLYPGLRMMVLPELPQELLAKALPSPLQLRQADLATSL